MTFSVKQARQVSGFTQVQMAEIIGVSRDTYRRIEKNPESATILQGRKIAEVTGFCFDSIFLQNSLLKVDLQ